VIASAGLVVGIVLRRFGPAHITLITIRRSTAVAAQNTLVVIHIFGLD